jgi:hypothetical protein
MTENPADTQTAALAPGIALEVLQSIGLLLVKAGQAETSLTFMLLRFIDPDRSRPRLIPVLTAKGTKLKLLLIQTFAARDFPNERKNIKTQCEKVGRAFGKRDFVAHSLISPTTDPNQIEIFPVKLRADGVWPDEALYTAKDINGWGDEIEAACRRLTAKLAEIGVPM